MCTAASNAKNRKIMKLNKKKRMFVSIYFNSHDMILWMKMKMKAEIVQKPHSTQFFLFASQIIETCLNKSNFCYVMMVKVGGVSWIQLLDFIQKIYKFVFIFHMHQFMHLVGLFFIITQIKYNGKCRKNDFAIVCIWNINH